MDISKLATNNKYNSEKMFNGKYSYSFNKTVTNKSK